MGVGRFQEDRYCRRWRDVLTVAAVTVGLDLTLIFKRVRPQVPSSGDRRPLAIKASGLWGRVWT